MTRKNAIVSGVLVSLAVILAIGDAAAEAPSASPAVDPMSPLGTWTTVDDSTGKPKSLVRIWEKSGKIYGTIIKLINPKDGNPNPLCDKCPGAKKDKPVVGMTIINGLTKDDDEWSGGTI